ncbi:O-antigen ligase family protein [Rahnella sikkimica]|uniref:Ligase n=1 Tax=Rahnella sikkimica TaxID=1805933 RepID=A0A2L1UYY3_9GAMM|nr:O-antigen ligase family protein [Rahnella sikkimica]AVF38140.1 ligase [Rahnella sikkimica]
MMLLKKGPVITYRLAYQAIFIVICTALSTSLFVDAYPRKLLYLSGYVSLLFMAIKIKQKDFVFDRVALAVAAALMLIGSIRFMWGEMYSQTQFSDITSNYRTGGKLFIISGLMAYFFIAWRHNIARRAVLSGFAILLAGLIATTGFAVHEHLQTGLRIQLLTDSAGTVSYLITALALCTLFTGYRAVEHVGGRTCIFCITFLLNTLLLILTESRAGVLTLPILYLGFFCLTHARLIRFALIPLVVLMAAGFTMLPQSVWQRLDSIRTEIGSYNTNNDTSIGARFSIWKGGYASISWTLMGQSPDERTSKARQFIVDHERKNPEAYKNVQYHLHDDILETLSLQGIAGGVSILVFYLVLLIVPLTRRPSAIAILPASFVIFGLTDTVLIQSLSVTTLCLSVFVSYALLQSSEGRDFIQR